jgi:glycosyltransferase involved in cell wall biosynthesis
MKIAFVSLMRGASWGGSEELWFKTALQALAEGHSVETLTCSWSPVPPKIASLKGAGATTNFYYKDSQALLDRVAVKLGLKKAQSEIMPMIDADIFVISNGSIWDFIRYRVITDYIIGLGKPYIIVSHNTLDSGDNLDDARRDYAIKVLGKASRRLFVAERSLQGAERQLAASIGRYQIFDNPVNIRQSFIKPYPTTDKLCMASVGSLTCDIKGQDLLLEALSSEDWKNRDFSLRIYGTGPDESYLHHLINFYGLQDKVTLEGHVNNVDKIWESNQVLILSSTTEGAPMVIVEAMLSGRAVMGTDVGAVERYVLEGETGFLVEAAKPKYLAIGLEKLWNNRSLLKQMGEQAFHHATAITNRNGIEDFLLVIEAAC